MKTTINTTGMSCSHCENRTINALKELDDIQSVKASAKSGKVVIKHAKEETIQKAKDLIAEIGYEVLA